jgi:hypothetical protein
LVPERKEVGDELSCLPAALQWNENIDYFDAGFEDFRPGGTTRQQWRSPMHRTPLNIGQCRLTIDGVSKNVEYASFSQKSVIYSGVHVFCERIPEHCGHQRFFNEIIATCLDCFLTPLFVVRRYGNDWNAAGAINLPQTACGFEAIHHRHVNIHKD